MRNRPWSSTAAGVSYRPSGSGPYTQPAARRAALAAMTLDVAHAEWAGGGPGYALVRLTGAARDAPAGARLAPPTLLVADGASWRRLAPVPGTPLVAPGAPFAVAFEIPLHLAVDE